MKNLMKFNVTVQNAFDNDNDNFMNLFIIEVHYGTISI